MSGKNNNSQRRLPATLPPPPKQESIPDSSSSALAITNRFVPLGSPLGSTVGQFRPNYQTALASPYDPYSSMPSPSTQKTPSFAKTSPYVKKHPMEQLFSIPHHINKKQSPDKIAKIVFPPNLHYIPSDSHKSLQYYQAILSETAGVSIKPIYSTTQPIKLLYHSLHIAKFITEQEWGIPLFHTKQLLTKHELIPNNRYNYFDYIQAWSNIFLHQTSDFSHSWFVTFDKSFRLNFPAWFPNWWSAHGLTASLLPEDLMKFLSTGFQQHFDRSRFDSRITLLSLFMAKYKVPWIFKWNYEYETGEIYRARWVKWWDKFDCGRIISLVSSEFPSSPTPTLAPPATSSQALPPASSTQALPEIPENTQSLSDISPSSSLIGKQSKTAKSSKSSSSKKKGKSSQLLKMADKLIAKAALLQSSSEEEEEVSSSDSSDVSSQPKKWADQVDAHDPYPDAQDPYDL